MRNRTLVLILCLGSSLLGCSNKPDVSDVEPAIKEAWGTCKLLKFSDIKKTNGIDHGNSYEMGISYKLEVLKDLTADKAWHSFEICPQGMYQPWWAYGRLAKKFDQPLKMGEVIEVNDVFTMVKSEKGWIAQ